METFALRERLTIISVLPMALCRSSSSVVEPTRTTIVDRFTAVLPFIASTNYQCRPTSVDGQFEAAASIAAVLFNLSGADTDGAFERKRHRSDLLKQAVKWRRRPSKRAARGRSTKRVAAAATNVFDLYGELFRSGRAARSRNNTTTPRINN